MYFRSFIHYPSTKYRYLQVSIVVFSVTLWYLYYTLSSTVIQPTTLKQVKENKWQNPAIGKIVNVELERRALLDNVDNVAKPEMDGEYARPKPEVGILHPEPEVNAVNKPLHVEIIGNDDRQREELMGRHDGDEEEQELDVEGNEHDDDVADTEMMSESDDDDATTDGDDDVSDNDDATDGDDDVSENAAANGDGDASENDIDENKNLHDVKDDGNAIIEQKEEDKDPAVEDAVDSENNEANLEFPDIELANFTTEFYGPFDFKPEEMSRIVYGWKLAYDKTMKKPIFDVFNVKKRSYLPNFRNPCYYEEEEGEQVLQCLPKFMLIGVQKCGTTDLYDKMMIHPNISRARTKEPFWFSRGRFKGKPLENYITLYEKATQKIETVYEVRSGGVKYHPVVTGEGSAGTIWDAHCWMSAPENVNKDEPTVFPAHSIRHLLPDTRFILILREPTNRLYSDYNFFMNFKNAQVKNPGPEDFHNRAVYGIKWLNDCFNAISRKHCLFDPPSRDLNLITPGYFFGPVWNPVARLRLGLYSEYLEEWSEIFPLEQTLVIRMEDYSVDRLGELNKIFKHVGLDTLPSYYEDKLDNMNIANVQKKTKPEPMWEKTRYILNQFYAKYNERLAQMLNDDRFLWKK